MTLWRFCVMSLCLTVLVTAQEPTPAGQSDEPKSSEETPKTMTPEEKALDFVRYFEAHVRPLEVEANIAWWDANLSGDDADFEKKKDAENRLNEILAAEYRFEQLKQIREETIADPLLRRQLDLLYLRYLPRQVNTDLMRRITDKANNIEQKFNRFRPTIDQNAVTDSALRKILKESTDSEGRRKAWEASKAVGTELEAEIRELVVLRNEAARSVGFDNYHAMQLHLSEQSPESILKLFDQLDALTRDPYLRAKQEIDSRLAARYQIPVSQLRPWHYHDPFFQEAPKVSDVDLDGVFAKVDIPAICGKFYGGIGLPMQDVLEASDLFERPGKSPHAFCTDINRDGDVRVLANIVPNEYWMTTTLHELGHAVYSSKFIPDSLPYLLRTDAHILATEGMAMMFERLPASSTWLAAMGIQVPDPAAYDAACRTNRRNKLLIFSRWCQVMYRFEMELYRDPSQDLNKLWWDLVEKYQAIHRPEGRNAPDYASKIHIVSAPAYYHNYMLGELFACQLHATICHEVLHADDPATTVYAKKRAVGKFLQDRVFQYGASLSWNELTKQATGTDLNAQAFANEFRH